MKRFLGTLLSAGLALGLAGAARAQENGLAFVSINGVRTTISVDLDPQTGKLLLLNGGTPFVFTNGDAIITVSGTANPDPFLNYAVAASTGGGGGTTAFSFGFGPIDITDCPPGSIISSTLSGSLTSGDADGATISPNANPFVATFTGTADVPAGSLDLGPAQTFAGGPGTQPYPPAGIFSASQVVGPGGATSLGILVDFTLTNTNDSVALTGQVNCLEVVPEPGTFALMGAAVCVGGGLLSRRQRRR